MIDTDSDTMPSIGQIVLVKKGREVGNIAVVIHQLNERFVLIADGNKRKFDRPKKKNIQHLKKYPYVSPEVQNSIKKTGRVTNGIIRYALTKFVNEVLEDQKEGNG